MSKVRSNASTKLFVEDCENGTVKELLEYGLRFEDFSNKYNISHGSVQKFIRLFGLSKYSKFAKCVPHKFRPESNNIVLTDAQKLALCTPWVRNETDRYYYPF